jgi:hypothetical protein
VFVADAGNDRIERFSASGQLVLAFGADVGGSGEPVCLAAEAGTCNKGTSGSAPGQFTTPQFVAVDNDSASPSFHDVYVADVGDGIVSKFTPEGVLVESWGLEGQLNGSTTVAKTFGALAGIAVGSDGTLYVLNASGVVFKFEPGSGFEGEFQLAFEASPAGLAVNSAGELFTAAFGFIFAWEASGGFRGFLTLSPVEPDAIAAGPEDGLYFTTASGAVGHYAFNGSGEVVEANGSTCAFVEAGGCEPSDLVPVGFAGAGVAATAEEDVLLSNPAEGLIAEFSSPLPVPEVTTHEAEGIAPHSAELRGEVSPGGVSLTTCAFEYIADEQYAPNAVHPYAGGGVAACVPAAASLPTGEASDVHAEITGLRAGVTYHYRLTATNPNGEATPGADATFETLPPPAITSAKASNLTETTAVLNAQVNPEFSSTQYHFEYDTAPYEVEEAGHGTRIPASPTEDAVLAAGSGASAVTAQIKELSAGRLYFWRIVATNESGTTTGVQHMFIYETQGALPDGRGYELVSPVHKNGAFLSRTPHLAPNGERVMTTVIQCFDSSESCTADRAGIVGNSPYAFTRKANGWVAEALAPSAAQFGAASVWGFDALTGDVLLGMPRSVEQGGNNEDDLYVRDSTGLTDMGPVTPPAGGAHEPKGGITGGRKQAATADYSHFAWEAPAADAFEAGTGVFTTYEYVRAADGLSGSGATQPLLVGVSGGEGSRSLISSCQTSLGGTAGFNEDRYPGSLSEDGRTVLFTALGPCDGTGANEAAELPVDEVFARVDGELQPEEAQGLGAAQAHTVAISEPSEKEVGGREELAPAAPYAGCEAAPCIKDVNEAGNFADAEFVAASSNGHRAFFLSPQQLTDDASEDPNKEAATGGESDTHQCAAESKSTEVGGCNLYLFDLAANEGEQLTDASRGDVSGEGPRVQGVLALSSDGSHVYFVAKGVLTTTPNGRGQVAHNGADNLYLYEQDAAFPHGQTVYITTMVAGELGVGDELEWNEQSGQPANVSPDGQFLVFLSRGDLTADDSSVSIADQVFRYDAVTNVLSRVSIGNDGFNDDGNRSSPGECVVGCAEDANIVPVAKPEAERPDPSMSDDGSRVFFESPVGLTPGALDNVTAGEVNGRKILAQNVYEWEHAGAGSCPASRAAGCVFLISDGQDVFKSESDGVICEEHVLICLLGTDTTGRNVFFATADSLIPRDQNSEVDYYDARVCEPGGCVKEPAPTVSCEGEGCRGEPQVQVGLPDGGSLTVGLDNLPAVAPVTVVKSAPPPAKKKTPAKKCKKGFARKHGKGKCVRVRKGKRRKHVKHAARA